MANNCTQCVNPQNPAFKNCPPRMDDGRHFTDYRPKCVQQYDEAQQMNSYEYRMFLTNNAEQQMKQNAVDAYMRNRCGPCVEPFFQGTMVPELEKQVCNERTCTFKVNDPYGLGLGRSYYSPEQEDQFNKVFSEQKTQEAQFFKQQPQCCDTVNQPPSSQTIVRPSIPGGGVPF